MDAKELKAAILAELPDFEAQKRDHESVDDCGCSYKDCYYCGMWHNCVHRMEVSLVARIRMVLNSVV